MKIFITGAEGFIGSHLTEFFVKKKYDVTALVFYNFTSSLGWLSEIEKKNYKNLKIIYGDVRDLNFIKKSSQGSDVIFHLAALISIPYSYRSPRSYLDTNLMGTYNILESSISNKVKKVIITSTSEVYGTAKYTPIDEIHALQPQSPYSASKIAADNLALSYFYSFGVPVTILRPFNTFGPRQSTRAVIPSIITQVLFGKKIINLGNLTPSRDFTYVNDTVNAFYKCILAKKTEGEIINICNGADISIKELIFLLKNELNLDFKVLKSKERYRPLKSEVFRLNGDNKKAKRIINWSPEFRGKKGFIKALLETFSWYNKEENIKKFKDFYSS
jgi:NAD dependent epimerase/dehydratase